MSALLALVPWYWRLGAVAALAATSFAFGYLNGSEAGEDALDALQAKVEKTTGELLARQGERARIAAATTKEKDARHAEDLQEIRDYWTGYAERLRRGAGGRPAGEPVREPAAVCDDPARDQRLSYAVAVARSEIRDALAEYRAGVGELSEAGELQTADLIDLQETWAHRQLLNNQP